MKKMLFAVLATALLAPLAPVPGSGQEAAPEISVMTFNIWGIIGAKTRVVRAEAIGKRIAELDPDIIAIEEAFEKRHRKALMKSLEKNGYEIGGWRYFNNIYGSGVLFITRFEIEEAVFEPYRVIGGANDIEWLGGKGIACIRLKTPFGSLDFFHTHAIARMTPIFDEAGSYIPGDPKQVDRLLNMYQIDRFIRANRTAGIRSIIAAGDFNVSPEMLEYQFLVRLTGFENSFDLLHPGENPSTFSIDNVWVTDDYSRIDHVFFKNFEGDQGFWVTPEISRVLMTETFMNPRDDREINYSDHYGLLTVFRVRQGKDAPAFSSQGVVPRGHNGCPADGVHEGAILVDSGNAEVWQDAALRIFSQAYQKQDRKNGLLVPMAAVVAADPGQLPLRVEVPSRQAKRLERACAQAKRK